jgi:putative oxidoreductase
MSFSELISPLVGRLVLAWFFLTSSFAYGAQWHATITLMALKDLPMPALLLFGAILLMIIGGLSLIFGFYARAGALMLFAFTVAASVLMHDYWQIHDHAARAADYDVCARTMPLAGGVLLVVGMGAGPFSIDNRMGNGRD